MSFASIDLIYLNTCSNVRSRTFFWPPTFDGYRASLQDSRDKAEAQQVSSKRSSQFRQFPAALCDRKRLLCQSCTRQEKGLPRDLRFEGAQEGLYREAKPEGSCED